MSVSAFTGPLVSFGQAPTNDYNAQGGPSLFSSGAGLLDPRSFYTYKPGMRGEKAFYGFLGTTAIPVLDVTATAAGPAVLAASQAPTAGTALTLVSSTSAPITVGVSIVRADTGATVTGLISIHGAAAGKAFGQGGTAPVYIWDPTTLAARNVTVTSAGDDSGGTFTIAGYDIYGYPMTETLTGANAGAATGAKAFKYIASITPAGTLSGSNVTAGIGVLFGLPLRADVFGQVYAVQNNAVLTTSSMVYAVTTDPATATTGDVRGTVASGGATRLTVAVSPSVANIGSVTGLFGVTQA